MIARETTLSDKKIMGFAKIMVCAMVMALGITLYSSSSYVEVLEVQSDFLVQGLRHCKRHKESFIREEHRKYNPRYGLFLEEDNKVTIIKNAIILDGDGKVNQTENDIFMVEGLIRDILASNSLESEKLTSDLHGMGVEIIDAKDHYVSPGLVEMHSHIGICSQPELKGVNDMFELMLPVTPFTRVIDAFNLGDPSIQMAAAGGVTSALVLPSANLISGEGFTFKFAIPKSRSVEEMLVEYSTDFLESERRRYMKMACGENPKRRFKAMMDAPKSRMGLGHLFRETMQKAQDLKDRQDTWCELALSSRSPSERYPVDDNLDLLVELLRGKVRSNVHCYETFDVETIFRHSREMGIEINALHHALDAFRIPEIIKKQPYEVAIATFASTWGFKKEAFQSSLFGPKIMEENNLTVVLTTDHPAIPQHSLINQAQIAHHYGLSSEKAFASVSGEPSRVLQLDDRIGFLRKGFDADIIIWNMHPLQMGAIPLKVFIDGHKVVDQPIRESVINDAPNSVGVLTENELDSRLLENSTSFLVTGIKQSFLADFPIDQENGPYEIYVSEGGIKCFKSDCSTDYPDSNIIKLENAYISPSLTVLTQGHGLVEMELEDSTGDGELVEALKEGTLLDFKDPQNIIKAKHGIRFGGIHLLKAFNLGVGKLITPPFRGEGNLFVTGVSAAFNAGGSTLEDIVQDEVALHITMGSNGKQKGVPTISSQIELIEALIRDNSLADNTYGKVARKELKLAIHTNSKDIILHLISLKQKLDIDIVIVGGIESHLLAPELAKNNIPVVVTIWQCQRRFWDERRCLSGLAGQSTVLKVLHDAGVLVGIGVEDDSKVRILLQDSGLAAALSGLSTESMLQMMTSNMDSIFELSNDLSFFVTTGDPLTYGSRVAAIVKNGTLSKVYPDIEPDLDSLTQ